MHHVIPRLKPGGRKTLTDGLETQGRILLFHNLIVLPKKGYELLANKKIQGVASISAGVKNTDIDFDSLTIILKMLCCFLKITIQGRDICSKSPFLMSRPFRAQFHFLP